MTFDFELLYSLLGRLNIVIIILIIILFIILLVFGKIFLKRGIVIFPKFLLFIIDTLYSPFKSIARLIKLDDHLIDDLSIQIRNDINKKKFAKIPANETLIFLPHCLRHKDCPATLQKEGVNCTCCGLCSIGVIKKKA